MFELVPIVSGIEHRTSAIGIGLAANSGFRELDLIDSILMMPPDGRVAGGSVYEEFEYDE
jgi:hypothetical protein